MRIYPLLAASAKSPSHTMLGTAFAVSPEWLCTTSNVAPDERSWQDILAYDAVANAPLSLLEVRERWPLTFVRVRSQSRADANAFSSGTDEVQAHALRLRGFYGSEPLFTRCTLHGRIVCEHDRTTPPRLQVDFPMLPGFCGAPLLDNIGDVAGVLFDNRNVLLDDKPAAHALAYPARIIAARLNQAGLRVPSPV